jgi:hypothetical protein
MDESAPSTAFIPLSGSQKGTFCEKDILFLPFSS